MTVGGNYMKIILLIIFAIEVASCVPKHAELMSVQKPEYDNFPENFEIANNVFLFYLIMESLKTTIIHKKPYVITLFVRA